METKSIGTGTNQSLKWDFPTSVEGTVLVPKGKIKKIDDKGRLSLGKDFAGRDVRIEETDQGFIASYVVQVPANEAWLWENEKALTSVRKGIEEAAAGKLTSGPEGWKELVADSDSSAEPE